MSAQTKEWLRPSMLPKLALCGHYRPDAAGDAAARGTAMDAAFRELIASGQNTTGLESEELEAVAWAADTAQALAVGWPLFSDETQLKIEALGLTGTADLLC